jgi:DNA-binding Lrp family transcriptional regulator
LDEIDYAILSQLQEEARVSNVELADRVGLSPVPARRVQSLEKDGIIGRYVTLLNPNAVDCGVTIFVQISLDLQVEGRLEAFEQAILGRREVLECYLMTGDADYLIRVVVPDVAAYERFLKDSLTRVEGVAGIKSSFALRQVKYSTAAAPRSQSAQVHGRGKRHPRPAGVRGAITTRVTRGSAPAVRPGSVRTDVRHGLSVRRCAAASSTAFRLKAIWKYSSLAQIGSRLP